MIKIIALSIVLVVIILFSAIVTLMIIARPYNNIEEDDYHEPNY